MGINFITITLLFLVVGYHFSQARTNPIPIGNPLLVPIQVGKTKTYVSQTRDAGMYIEKQRRSAIISNPSPVYSFKGSTNGSLERFLTSHG